MKKLLKTYPSVAVMAAHTMPPKMAVQVIAEIMTGYQPRLKELELRILILESKSPGRPSMESKAKAPKRKKVKKVLGRMGKLTTDGIMDQIRKDHR